MSTYPTANGLWKLLYDFNNSYIFYDGSTVFATLELGGVFDNQNILVSVFREAINISTQPLR